MKNPVIKQRFKTGQSGATIVEILVAVLILSFGMLGMGALQTRALQGNVSSTQKSQAITLANYMLDIMRVDRNGASIGNYNINDVCGPAGISGTDLAKNSLRDWLTNARDNLGGSGTSPVCGTVQCTINLQCTVRLRWDDSQQGGLSNPSVELNAAL